MASDREQIVEVVDADPVDAAWQPVVGDVTSRLREYLVSSGDLPTIESANRVIAEACRVLSHCIPPTGATEAHTGLVCGYVQSGKTASMTAVSALAKDNGYRIIILIAGVTTNLVEQNRDRMETHLRAAAPEWVWLMLNNPRLRDQPQIERLRQTWRSEYYDDHDRQTLFISVMKNHSHLRNLAALLSSMDLSDLPAIIFDDEADQASLNTRPNDSVASSTYRHIEALRRALPRHTYLQYTATPQAPLLITRIDSLSADFAELVSPGEGYTGGQEFFGAQNSHVEIIPQSEIYRDGQLPLAPPPSLLRAMMVFFIGVAAGRLGAMQTHRSMLIHPSKATATHRQYFDWADNLMAHWHRVLLAAGEPDREELLAEFREAYADLARTCGELPPFEQIQTRLPIAINHTAVTLVNSVDGREVPWPNSPSHILVGGEKLGRGYTVKGLTITYMPRSPGGWTADTIQQRARFFGYHNKYFGYCRVYLHAGVRDAYVAYVRHEQDMRGRLEEHRGRPLQEWRRLFYLERRLAPTRRNVLSSPYFRPRFPEGWFLPRAPHVSPLDGRQNQEIVSRLESLEFEVHKDHPQHHYAVAYLRDVFEQVLVPLSYLDERDALGLCVVNCNLATLLEREDDARCLVYLMRRGRLRTRTFKNGEIETLHQGRSSAGAQSYPGDRAFSDGNLPTVQIHMLSVHDLDRAQVFDNVPAIAIKLHQQEDMLVHDE